MTSSKPNPAEAIGTAMMGLGEMFQQITDMAAGQKAQIEAAGFSPTEAEAMAGHLYREAVTWMFDQMKQHQQKGRKR